MKTVYNIDTMLGRMIEKHIKAIRRASTTERQALAFRRYHLAIQGLPPVYQEYLHLTALFKVLDLMDQIEKEAA